ncbi:MAG TPA: hypothetical protein VFA74_00455 [Terriglobales bacterium]|nr:hypothetical protein [Terriglobales bacterium]
MLDLDEMKQMWADHDRKLEESIRLNMQLLSAAKLDKTQSALMRLTIYMALEAAVWLVIIVALGSFIYEHISQTKFVVSAVILDLYSIGMLNSLIRQIAASRLIDYGKPVAMIQKQIEALRIMRIRTTKWGVLTGFVVWVPSMIVVFKAAFRVNLYEPYWVWSMVTFGLALIPLTIWTSKRFSERMDGSSFIQSLMKSLAGYNLTAAADFVASVSEFQNEKHAS